MKKCMLTLSLFFAIVVAVLAPQHATAIELPTIKKGLWWNSATPGTGIGIYRNGNTLIMLWYTYRPDGSPIWYIGSGEYTGNLWQANALRMNWNGAQAVPTVVGTFNLDFNSPDAATFDFNIDGNFGNMKITPFLLNNIIPEQDYTGLWYEAENPGWGMSMGSQGGFEYTVLYFYDSAGDPIWLLGTTDFIEKTVYGLGIYNGSCPTCAYFAPEKNLAGSIERFQVDPTQTKLPNNLVIDLPPSQGRRATFNHNSVVQRLDNR